MIRTFLEKPWIFFGLMSIVLTASIGAILSVLTVYLEHVIHFSSLKSVQAFVAFLKLLYCGSALGGAIGGRYSYRGMMNFGFICIVLGAGGLYFQWSHVLLLWFSLLVLGYGLCTPCFLAVFSQTLHENLNRYHSSFVLIYMGMNIGAVLGISTSSAWRLPSQYHDAFLISLLLIVFLAVSLNSFLWKQRQEVKENETLLSLKKLLEILGISGLSLGIIDFFFHHQEVANFVLLGGCLATFLLLWAWGKKISKPGLGRRLGFYSFLSLVSVIFFILYNAEPDILTVFIEQHVDRNLAGMSIPASTYYLLNPVFNLLVGCGFLWGLKYFKGEFYPDRWIYLSLILMGLGFGVLYLGAVLSSGLISSAWIILAYAMLSAAEMCLAPVAYAMGFVYGLPKLYGIMAGISQLAIGIGAMFTSELAPWLVLGTKANASENLAYFIRGFGVISLIWLGIGFSLLLLRNPIRAAILGRVRVSAN